MHLPINEETLYKVVVYLPALVPFLIGMMCQTWLLLGKRERLRQTVAGAAGLALAWASVVLLDRWGHWPPDPPHWVMNISLMTSIAVSIMAVRTRLGLIPVFLCAVLCGLLIASRYRADYIAAGMFCAGAVTAFAHGVSRIVLRVKAV